MAKDKKICPMMTNHGFGTRYCEKEKCEWYVVWNRGKKNEYGECCMKSLPYLGVIAR